GARARAGGQRQRDARPWRRRDRERLARRPRADRPRTRRGARLHRHARARRPHRERAVARVARGAGRGGGRRRGARERARRVVVDRDAPPRAPGYRRRRSARGRAERGTPDRSPAGAHARRQARRRAGGRTRTGAGVRAGARRVMLRADFAAWSAVFTEREDGDLRVTSRGEGEPLEVVQARILDLLGVAAVVVGRPVHGADVVVVDEAVPGYMTGVGEADG